MPSRADDYESIVRSLLLSRLAGLEQVATLNSFHLKRYTGKSGQEHEIDVSFEVDLAGVLFLILVECKDYGRKVGVDDVMTFVYRLRDIGAHKGLLVTTHGFQAGAAIVAKSEGVGLLIAAKGVLHVYLGAQYMLYEHWISGFELGVSTDGAGIIVLGKRHIAGNCHSRVVSLHARPARIEVGDSQLAFLTAEEESQLEFEAEADPRERLFRSFGRRIPSKQAGNAVVLC